MFFWGEISGEKHEITLPDAFMMEVHLTLMLIPFCFMFVKINFMCVFCLCDNGVLCVVLHVWCVCVSTYVMCYMYFSKVNYESSKKKKN